MKRIFLCVNTLLVATGMLDLSLTEPSLDRWFYPFNGTPGTKTSASIFGPITTLDGGFDPHFDNRDGQMLVGFDTSGLVPTGLGAGGYTVSSAAVTLTVSNDGAFEYDPTPDPFTSWLATTDPDYTADADAGRPVELFGVAFRCGGPATAFPENGAFCAGCNCLTGVCKAVRCAYPIDFDAGCAPRDVSNNVDQAFDPAPFAVGVNAGLAQGQPVPLGTELTFEIDVMDPCVQAYLAEAMDQGMLDFLVASIFFSAQQQTGAFPKLYCKEDPLVEFGLASAARLELSVQAGVPGDVTGDGIVNVQDLLILLGQWGSCPAPCPPSCQGDLNGDCQVDVNDLLIMLSNWTT